MLTLPQAACLTTILDFKRRGVDPSLQQIADVLDVTKNAAVHLVRALQSRGYVRRERGRQTITVLRPPIVSVYRFDTEVKELLPLK